MTGYTPLYSIPYLEGSSPARQIAATSQDQAETIEALLRDRNVEPLDSDKADIVSRLNALESARMTDRPGLQGLNGYTVLSSSSFFTFGNVAFIVGELERDAGVNSANCLQIPVALAPPGSVTFMGVASQGGSAGNVTLVLGPTGVIRNWSNSTANKRLSFTLFWKIGI